jgi:hypothetical protein
MSDESQLDEQLTRHFGALRAADARRAPDFGAMRAAAQSAIPDAAPTAFPVHAVSRRRRPRVFVLALPVLAAAGLLLLLRPRASSADREFEALVTEWSRTTAATRSSPTDALLSLPGDEYLRGMPTLGGDRLPSRTRNSS